MLSSIFQVMPLYAWIIIGCVIVLAVVVLIKLRFFGKSEDQQLDDELDKYLKNVSDAELHRTHIGGIRKNKNIKKRRKYKK